MSYPYFAVKNNIIKKPIFLVGNQGDGLTLASRMLRKNSNVISVTGNNKYWSGASELQNVFEPILNSKLSGIRFQAPRHPQLKPPRSWSYACDDLIYQYRNTDRDVTSTDYKKLKNAIQISLFSYARNITQPRFVDKSQVFSVKMSFIAKLLEEYNPMFIHVTRNPYATIYRAADGKAGDMKRYSKFMTFDQRFQTCLEHWYNTAQSIETDKPKVSHFMRIRFEDLLANPHDTLKKVCDFAELEFDVDMLPQPEHKLPLGTKYEERWYPLRADVNDSYLNKISPKYIEKIQDKCGYYAELFGYYPPIKG